MNARFHHRELRGQKSWHRTRSRSTGKYSCYKIRTESRFFLPFFIAIVICFAASLTGRKLISHAQVSTDPGPPEEVKHVARRAICKAAEPAVVVVPFSAFCRL